MFFIKDICQFFVSNVVAWSIVVSGGCFAASTGLARFATDWEPVSRGLGAITAPSPVERVSLAKFRDSKLILDTAIKFIESNMTADASLVMGMARRRFNWETSVFQPLRNALARLDLLKRATDVSSSGDSCGEERAVLANSVLQYMVAHSKKMQHDVAQMHQLRAATAFAESAGYELEHAEMDSSPSSVVVAKAASKFLGKLKDKSSGDTSGDTVEVVDSTPAVATFSSLAYVDDVTLDFSGGSSIDIKAEFTATEEALEQLENDIMAMLTGRVVTRTKTVVEKAPPPPPLVPVVAPVWPLSLPDAMARLKALEPELNMLMGVLAGATGGVTAAAKILEARARSKARTLGMELELYKEMSALLALIDGGLVDV